MLGGTLMLRKLFFPLFLLFFMVPIPAVIYNRITFPLQLLASRLAGDALSVLGLPVLREGNILELPEQRLSVVEACSGIRSLLTLTFLSLVFGHFFERKIWIRVVLFLSTVPIAIVANASRVTLTGINHRVEARVRGRFLSHRARMGDLHGVAGHSDCVPPAADARRASAGIGGGNRLELDAEQICAGPKPGVRAAGDHPLHHRDARRERPTGAAPISNSPQHLAPGTWFGMCPSKRKCRTF